MKLFTVICGNCRAKAEVVLTAPSLETTCPSCQAEIALDVFPALFKEPSGHGELANTTPVIGDEANCFYHIDHKAQTVCESCGRFLCALCDVEFAGAHVCSPCIENAAKVKKARNLQRAYYRYDQMALGLGLLAIIPFFFFFTIFTAPMAIFISLYFWKRPLSVLPVGHGRFVLAILMACGGLAFLGMMVVFMIMGAMRGG